MNKKAEILCIIRVSAFFFSDEAVLASSFFADLSRMWYHKQNQNFAMDGGV